MNLLTIEKLTKVYTERRVFDGADFSINEGEKIGVIGVNGTGGKQRKCGGRYHSQEPECTSCQIWHRRDRRRKRDADRGGISGLWKKGIYPAVCATGISGYLNVMK